MYLRNYIYWQSTPINSLAQSLKMHVMLFVYWKENWCSTICFNLITTVLFTHVYIMLFTSNYLMVEKTTQETLPSIRNMQNVMHKNFKYINILEVRQGQVNVWEFFWQNRDDVNLIECYNYILKTLDMSLIE